MFLSQTKIRSGKFVSPYRCICVNIHTFCMATLANSPNFYLPLLSARRAHTHIHTQAHIHSLNTRRTRLAHIRVHIWEERPTAVQCVRVSHLISCQLWRRVNRAKCNAYVCWYVFHYKVLRRRHRLYWSLNNRVANMFQENTKRVRERRVISWYIQLCKTFVCARTFV